MTLKKIIALTAFCIGLPAHAGFGFSPDDGS
jgi:hypothetical protein